MIDDGSGPPIPGRTCSFLDVVESKPTRPDEAWLCPACREWWNDPFGTRGVGQCASPDCRAIVMLVDGGLIERGEWRRRNPGEPVLTNLGLGISVAEFERNLAGLKPPPPPTDRRRD